MLNLNLLKSIAGPFDYLQMMDIITRVEMKIGGSEAIWCLAVQQAIRSGKPAREIIASIKDMACDNYNAIADVLGCSLTDKIIKS